MSTPKDFTAVLDSDARKTQRRIAFITKRTSPQVRVKDEERRMTYPEVFVRAAVAIEALAIALVVTALLWDAPLEGLADPMHTPNPAKAPWYFLGLQEMLHYFPPVVAGVLVPGLVVMALIVIPYFKVNIEAGGFFLKDRADDGGCTEFSAVGFSVGAVFGGTATFVLGDDLVLIRTGCADGYRHV